MISSSDGVEYGNRLLAALPPPDRQRIGALLKWMPFHQMKILYHARGPMEHVYFPEIGVLSAMTIMEDGRAIEVATIGREGMVGSTASVRAIVAPYQVMVQVAGDGWQMPTEAFEKELHREGALRDIVARYHNAYYVQLSYAVACNGLHTVEKRCCRWLLMTQDRIDTSMLPLTHELLAIMLGVRRASVTEVLHPLQQRGLVRCGRGEIEVLDRAGLERSACECYRAVVDEFARIFGP